MKWSLTAAAALAALPQIAAAPASAAPLTIEYYYKIRWGSAAEFKQLYARNHQPILDEMKRQGFITALRTEEPFTHMAGAPRWDLRVSITYRDAEAAVGTGGAYDKASEAAMKRLYPDKSAHIAAETRRFSLLEEHWDVIVMPAGE